MRGHAEILGRWEVGKWNTRRKGTPTGGYWTVGEGMDEVCEDVIKPITL